MPPGSDQPEQPCSWTAQSNKLLKFRVMRSVVVNGRAACEQAVSRPHIWAPSWEAARQEVERVMGASYWVTQVQDS